MIEGLDEKRPQRIRNMVKEAIRYEMENNDSESN